MKSRGLAWALLSILVGGIVLFRLLPAAVFTLLPGCLFSRVTGFFCVSCGATRAVWFIARGELARSLSMNIFVVPGIIFLLYVATAALVNGYTGKRILPEIKFGWQLYLALILLALAFLIIRNIPGYPYDLFAPSC